MNKYEEVWIPEKYDGYYEADLNFEPDIILIKRKNQNVSEVAKAGIQGIIIFKDKMYATTYAASDTSVNDSNGGQAYDIDGYYCTQSVRATCDNGHLNVFAAPGSRKFAVGVEYLVEILGFGG